jgi:signal transduction histidine kinase
MLADFAPTVLVISLVLGTAAAAAAAYIGRTIAAPIEALSVYSKRVSMGERPNLPTEVAGREVARLVTAIHTMRERLEGRPFVETFAADLSHELKNPVAAIRASAEVLMGFPDQNELAELSGSINLASDILSDISIDPATGTLTLSYSEATLGESAQLYLTPVIDAGQLGWQCSADIFERYLPADCR